MTEAEWLASECQSEIAEGALGSVRASERTCRLFVAGFWEWAERNQPPSEWRDYWVKTAVRWGETGQATAEINSRVPGYVMLFHHSASEGVINVIDSLMYWNESTVEADAIQVTLLRDIFGNPFRPVTFSPSWRTSTAVALASQMYESRDFSAMPILADALQDAGCDNADVLNHCRDERAPHVRGCWVIDLVLGKV